MTLRMIDEASYQARTWTAARLRAAGVQVVAVKATEGTDYENPDWAWQVDEAEAAGCVAMSYHLARYTDSSAEARFFVQQSYLRPGDLVMLDNEANRITALSPTAAAAWVSAFTKEVRRLTGAPTVIQYTSRYPIDQGYFKGIAGFKDCPLFLADPGANPKAPPIIPGWPVSFLQYTTRTDGGTVTDVDCAYYGSVGQLRQLGIPQAPPKPGGPRKVTAMGAYSLKGLAGGYNRKPSDVIAATVGQRLLERSQGRHQWVLGGSEAAYLDAGDWSAPLPAGSVWWVP